MRSCAGRALRERAVASCWLAAWTVALVACGGRSAQLAAAADAAAADARRIDGAFPADVDPFCSGTAKALVNGAALAVESVTGEDYNSAAHEEGARVRLIASSAAGERWQLDVEVMAPLGVTLTDAPPPRTAAIGPPAGLEGHVFFMRPPACTSLPTCQTDLLASDHHELRGQITLGGGDYRGPMELAICLSASDEGWPPAPKHEVHTVQLFVPAVTIPRWRLPWP